MLQHDGFDSTEEIESYEEGFNEGRDILKTELVEYFQQHYKGGDFISLGEVIRVINGIEIL
jgi:hypothetical protein